MLYNEDVYQKLINHIPFTYEVPTDNSCIGSCFSCVFLNRIKLKPGGKTVNINHGALNGRYVWIKRIDGNIDNIMKTYIVLDHIAPHLINVPIHTFKCNNTYYVSYLTSEKIEIPPIDVAITMLNQLHQLGVTHGSIGPSSFAITDGGSYIFTEMSKSITKFNRPLISSYEFYNLQSMYPDLSEYEIGVKYDKECLQRLYS